jgi:hypothetical protein
MGTDNDSAESCFLSTDGECSAPPEPLPWTRGEANGDRRALVQSEQCAVLRYGGGTGRCDLAAWVARALQRYPGRACMALLLRPQEVRRVEDPCTRCDPKTLDSSGQYIPPCRRKGQWRIRLFGPAYQTLACCTCLSHRSRYTTAPTKRRPQSDGALGEESPGRARDKHARRCARPPHASATPMASAGVSRLWPLPPARAAAASGAARLGRMRPSLDPQRPTRRAMRPPS